MISFSRLKQPCKIKQTAGSVVQFIEDGNTVISSLVIGTRDPVEITYVFLITLVLLPRNKFDSFAYADSHSHLFTACFDCHLKHRSTQMRNPCL